MKKFAVKMSNVIKEMKDKFCKTFFGHNILLPAYMAKMAYNSCSAIQAVLFFPFRCVGQTKILLKISTKNTSRHFFFVTEQLNYF